ncbi:MAG: tetratricopeptide repeat protein [Bacteroidia bacterium]|jgi:hypothetical protein
MKHHSEGNARVGRLQSLIRQNPQDPFLQYALGLEWEKQLQWEAAEEIWRKLLLSHSDYLPAMQRLAELYWAQENWVKAHECATEAHICAEKLGDTHAQEIANDLLEQIEARMNEG